MSDRIAEMKKSIDALNDAGVRTTLFYKLAYDSLIKTKAEPVQIRRAKAEANILDNAPLPVLPHELIVGTMVGLCPPLENVPSYESQKEKGIRVLDAFLEKKKTAKEPLRLETTKDKPRMLENLIEETEARWALMNRVYHDANINYSDLQKVIAEMKELYKDKGLESYEIARELERCFKIDYGPGIRQEVNSTPWFVANHLHLDYGRMIRKGYDKLLDEIKTYAAKAETAEQKEYYEAARITAEASVRFMKRYVVSIREAAAAESGERKAELTVMADIVEKLVSKPAGSFREAVQFVWLLQIQMSLVWGSALSLGRFDQYMCEFYDKDLASGAITHDDAKELLCCLWLKINEPKLRTVQSMLVGGLTPEGENGANSMTELVLEVTRDMKLPYPNLGVRINPKNPDWLYDKVIDTIKAGGGMPQMFNDLVFVESMKNMGYEEKYANDYYNMGCVELMIAGKQPSWIGTDLPSFPVLVERVFKKYNEGQLKLESFEAFMKAYDDELLNAIEVGKKEAEVRIAAMKDKCYDPFGSLFIDGCLENGKDMNQGGSELGLHCAFYSFSIGTAADSLIALKKFVYDEKKFTIDEMANFLKNNFEGAEDVRLFLENKTPRFGNDIDEVDNLASHVLSTLTNKVMSFNSKGTRDKCVTTFFGYFNHILQGEITGATPNGRRKGETFSDSMGPTQGKDANGPASMLNSVLKIDHSAVTGGYALNLKVNPDLVRTEKGTKALKSLIKTYMADKGPQLQVYFVDADELKAAKQDPVKYRNIVVRVGGYCEYFVNLDSSLQDEIITRTIHGLG